MKLLPHHLRVLRALNESTSPDGEYCTSYERIADYAGMEKAETRRVVRHLTRKGLAEFYRGLFTDDGMLCGSGHCISKEGRIALASTEGQSDGE